MRKKIVVAMLIGASILSLCACGNSGTKSESGNSASNSSSSSDDSKSGDAANQEELDKYGLEYGWVYNLFDYDTEKTVECAIPYDEVSTNAADWNVFNSLMGYWSFDTASSKTSTMADVLGFYDYTNKRYTNDLDNAARNVYEARDLPAQLSDENETIESTTTYTNDNGIEVTVETGTLSWRHENSEVCEDFSFHIAQCTAEYGGDAPFFVFLIDMTEDGSQSDYIDGMMNAIADSFRYQEQED